MKNRFIKKYINNNIKIFGYIFMICLIILLIGFSYSFFVYNKTGLYTHTITGGKMSIIYNETTGNNITIDNAYPLTNEEAETKALEFEFTITGYNESDKNIYYAIEMDYGEDVSDKTRFKDSDLKLSLYENDEIKFENEIFNNLDNNDIYYGYIDQGTSSESPTINNYKLRIWINDDVLITDTPDMVNIEGKSVYSTEEFANRYANFKVNIKADLTYDDFGYITYDANGGTNAPEKTSVLTGMVTRNSPYNVTKINNQTVYNACIGWSSDPNAIEPEYTKGDYYNGDGELLYAVYSSDINVMSNLSKFSSYRQYVTEIYFINDTEENIETRYNNATIKYDLSIQGKVLGWLENDYLDESTSKQYYKLYIGSEGITYLSTGVMLMYNFSNATLIEMSNIDTSMVTDMSSMFYYCRNLTTLDLSNFDTSQVKNMIKMFNECFKLIELNVSNFDTSHIVNMSKMFYGCTTLTHLDLNNFNTSNVTDMSYMFSTSTSSTSYTEINVSNFDTSKVTDMSYMFYKCTNLTSLDLNHFNTSSVTNMAGMFANVYYSDEMNLASLEIENFDTSNVTNMSNMFAKCSNLSLLDVSKFNTSQVTDMSYMFGYCTNINYLDISNFDTSKVLNMNGIFDSCSNLVKLDVDIFNTTNVTGMTSMFSNCSSLTELDVSGFVTSNVTSMASMFKNCDKITELDVSGFDTSKVTSMESMFYGCSNLTELDVSGFNTSEVIYMDGMFSKCSKITILNVSNFVTNNVLYMGSSKDSDITLGMFYGCNSLINLDVSNFNTLKVKHIIGMFSGCKSLTVLDVSNFDTSNVTNMKNMFSGCSSLRALDVSNFDTTNVTNMWSMFQGCSSLRELDVNNFNVSNVTTMHYLFEGCSNLTTIYCNDDWNNGIVVNMISMFSECTSLVGAVSYNRLKVDITMANPDTGYFTRKTV